MTRRIDNVNPPAVPEYDSILLIAIVIPIRALLLSEQCSNPSLQAQMSWIQADADSEWTHPSMKQSARAPGKHEIASTARVSQGALKVLMEAAVASIQLSLCQ